MLQDLNLIRTNLKANIQASGFPTLKFTDKIKTYILNIYNDSFGKSSPSYSATCNNDMLVVTNNDGKVGYLPYELLGRIHHVRYFIDELIEYSKVVDDLKSFLTSNGHPKLIDKLPMMDWATKLSSNEVTTINQFISNDLSGNEIAFFEDFLDGRSWLDVQKHTAKPDSISGKKLKRPTNDYIASATKQLMCLIQDSVGKVDQYIALYLTDSALSSMLKNLIVIPSRSTPVPFVPNGENIIYYGAPGTGKSYTTRQLVGGHKSFTTVFHPDTQYSDFVGCLKPSMDASDIVYSFRQGPFLEALIYSYNNPSEKVFLIIEEINRAPTAAVFGELFQLLDRKADGSSEYGITISDPDMYQHILQYAIGAFTNDKLYIPSNLALLATMNSSDQAVMPMDAAFKRRWLFNYLPIDFSKAPIVSFDIKIKGRNVNVSWQDLAQIINEELVNIRVPEDRLLGPWFISLNDIADPKKALQKIYMYLWDDVLRHEQQNIVFKDSLTNYGMVFEKLKAGERVLNDKIENELDIAYPTPPSTP